MSSAMRATPNKAATPIDTTRSATEAKIMIPYPTSRGDQNTAFQSGSKFGSGFDIGFGDESNNNIARTICSTRTEWHSMDVYT